MIASSERTDATPIHPTQLYYTMRSRTLSRCVGDLVAKAEDGLALLTGRWDAMQRKLQRQAVLLQQALNDAAQQQQQQQQQQQHQHTAHSHPHHPHHQQQHGKHHPSSLSSAAPTACVAELKAAVQQVRAHRRSSVAAFEAARRAVNAATQGATDRLHIELQSAGNVRFEEGVPGESSCGWWESVETLVQERLGGGLVVGSCGGPTGIAGVRILQAFRIHNRGLKAQFEGGSSGDGAAAAGSTGSSLQQEQQVEYLFAGEHPAFAGELLLAAQAGFRPQHYAEQGLDFAVALHSSVLLADEARLSASLQSSSCDGCTRSSSSAAEAPAVGQLLICKVRLGAHVQDATAVLGVTKRDHPCVMQERFPGATAVYCSRDASSSSSSSSRAHSHPPPEAEEQQSHEQQQQQQRSYFVFDPTAVLPEYLIKFEYTFASTSKFAAAARRLHNSGSSSFGRGSWSRHSGDNNSLGTCPASICGFDVGGEQLAAAKAFIAAASEPTVRSAAQPLAPWLALLQPDGIHRLPSANVQLPRRWADEEAAWGSLLDCSASALTILSGCEGGDHAADQPAASGAAVPAARLLQRLKGAAAQAGTVLVRLDLAGCGLRDGDVAPLRALKSLKALGLAFNEICSLQVCERSVGLKGSVVLSTCEVRGHCPPLQCCDPCPTRWCPSTAQPTAHRHWNRWQVLCRVSTCPTIRCLPCRALQAAACSALGV